MSQLSISDYIGLVFAIFLGNLAVDVLKWILALLGLLFAAGDI